MKLKNTNLFTLLLIMAFVFTLAACNTGNNKAEKSIQNDSLVISNKSDKPLTVNDPVDTLNTEKQLIQENKKGSKDRPVIFIYNFHLTNRCVSCKAIEKATQRTLETYFPNEVKQGLIVFRSIDIDDKVNKSLAEKYGAFGSSLFVTRLYNGKEFTTDLTGEGFKYAKNKEEKFIEILQAKISEYLK
jgi:hypothetical protein